MVSCEVNNYCAIYKLSLTKVLLFRKVMKERGVEVLVVETPLEMIMRRKRLVPVQ